MRLSTGPLLALSLVDAAGAVSGPGVFGAVRDLAGTLSNGCATEFLHGAARGFSRCGDGQGLADTIELANVTASGRRSAIPA